MYSKEEAAKIRSEFWTSFGRYMQPVPSASGLPVNWMNYRTGAKSIRFLLDVDRKQAEVSVVLNATGETKDKMLTVLKQLHEDLNAAGNVEWMMDHNFPKWDKMHTRIFSFLPDVNIYRKELWPDIISFFKSSMIEIDLIWQQHKDIFEMLEES